MWRGGGRNKQVGHYGGKVGRPRAPDARNEGQEGTGDPGGPEAKSGRYSSGSGLCPSGANGFFADVPLTGQFCPSFPYPGGWGLQYSPLLSRRT